MNILLDWVLNKLETVKSERRVVVRDPLHLLPHNDNRVHQFAVDNSYSMIIASTNLAFRYLYEKAIEDTAINKILLVDRTPAGRKQKRESGKAPPIFYPELLAETSHDSLIELDLRDFLIEITGDPMWPPLANDRRYAGLIAANIDRVLKAHKILKGIEEGRFSDTDFNIVVAYSALGIEDYAFKKLDADAYWRIGLIGHSALAQLGEIDPAIVQPILKDLGQAPAPFCHFVSSDTDQVVCAYYLSLILSQHFTDWKGEIGQIDTTYTPLVKDVVIKTLTDSAPLLIKQDRDSAIKDLAAAEGCLDKEALKSILLDKLNLNSLPNIVKLLEQEHYSALFTSLAVLLALDNLLMLKTAKTEHTKIYNALFLSQESQLSFVMTNPSPVFQALKETYRLASNILQLQKELEKTIRDLGVLSQDKLTFSFFSDLWNRKKINRLEYYLSLLDRAVNTDQLLPRKQEELPELFSQTLNRIKENVQQLNANILKQLDILNRHFQAFVEKQYPVWIASDSDVRVTAQFLRRCLKEHWDATKEKAVILIFDGMRYDIWDEMLRPQLEESMELIDELPAISLLPSETIFTRKAICAGALPDKFDFTLGEDKLLKQGLTKEFAYKGEVNVIETKTGGAGEVVRYRADKLDIYIFELCDKALHGIGVKTISDGKVIPQRPLCYIYDPLIKNIIDKEVMAVVRNLEPGTRVFVIADHGFGVVGRESIWFRDEDLNDRNDCHYTYTLLKVPIKQADLPNKIRDNVIAFDPQSLHMPITESIKRKDGTVYQKTYKSIVFPRVGYAFSRSGSPFNPDAYSHGGISLQELMIPMAILKVRTKAESLLQMSDIIGPQEVQEDQEAAFKLILSISNEAALNRQELRVDVEAFFSDDSGQRPIWRQVHIVGPKGSNVICPFKIRSDDVDETSRKSGCINQTLTVTANYQDGRKSIRKSKTKNFKVNLNTDKVIRRVDPSLGKILGLAPKNKPK